MEWRCSIASLSTCVDYLGVRTFDDIVEVKTHGDLHYLQKAP